MIEFASSLEFENPTEEIQKAEAEIKSSMKVLQALSDAQGISSHTKPVLAENASTSRLIVLKLIFYKYQLDTYIETGTQHGVSASIIARHLKESASSTSIYTFDVTNNLIFCPEESVKYITLSSPVRRNFKQMTSHLPQGSSLFFHDSDHSSENMDFELDWAWNKLQVKILVADDIDLNNSFSKFVTKNNLKFSRIKSFYGTSIGVIIRE